MLRRHRVVWKLSMVVAAIVTLVIAAAGVVNNYISNHYALASARAVLKLNSESIVSGIDKLMLNRDNEGVLSFVQDVSKHNAAYRDIRLVSHRSGEVVVSSLQATGARLTKEDRTCARCHEGAEPAAASAAAFDEVITGRGDNRILSVVTPIANHADCQTADCHVHADSGPILGFLQTEYSLGEIDAVVSGLDTSFVVAALAAILLGTLALWTMFNRLLGKPIRQMIGGIRALAGDNLSFRFDTDRTDEFGLVARSFDNMAARIQAHQSELRDAMEYLEGIVENSADMIITVNPGGLIQTVNRGAETALGYRREELVGQRVEKLFANPRDRDVAIAKLRDQDNVTNLETRFLTKNKEERHVLLTLSRLRDRDGTALGTFGISKDVTREKNLQERLFQAEKEAAIGQAVTTIQHAIKNMLNALTGGSFLTRRGIEKSDKASTDDGLQMIDEGISRIKSLSMSMLRYAREWKPELDNTDIGRLIREVGAAIEQTAIDKGVTIRSRVADDLPPASCDANLIHMALMDMATNALDACVMKDYEDGEAAEIVFGASSEGDEEIVIVIEDNGIGMTEETKKRIFTPFFSTKESWGTGLGLVSASRIIGLHGGEIDVESQPGKGTKFRITLPLWNTPTRQGA